MLIFVNKINTESGRAYNINTAAVFYLKIFEKQKNANRDNNGKKRNLTAKKYGQIIELYYSFCFFLLP